jgi:hypothetical protein
MRQADKAAGRRGGRSAGRRLLALGATVVLAALGCARETVNGPPPPRPNASITTYDVTDKCSESGAPACGGFFPVILPPAPIPIGPGGMGRRVINPGEIGAWSKTWTIAEPGMLSLYGRGTITRGGWLFGTKEPFELRCSLTAWTCSDAYASASTCDRERNEVDGYSQHSAAFPSLPGPWLGRYNDSEACVPEPAPGGDGGSCGDDDTGESGEDDPEQPDGEYDPYDDGSCGGSGDGEPPTGSGTQFYPGDYTNGETVNWTTGIGNGGTSVCGDAARVEEICIDLWEAESGDWTEWSCGYATTC